MLPTPRNIKFKQSNVTPIGCCNVLRELCAYERRLYESKTFEGANMIMPIILNLRPANRYNDVAVFDVEIGGSLRVYNLSLRRTPNGKLRTLAPNAAGKHSASFTPELAEQITQAATAALKGGSEANARLYR